jgi:glutamate-1-semialdehyde aminotransferase
MRLRDGLADAARRHGLAAQVSGEPPVFDILFTDRAVVDYRATLTADRASIATINRERLRRGVVKRSTRSTCHWPTTTPTWRRRSTYSTRRWRRSSPPLPERRTLSWI